MNVDKIVSECAAELRTLDELAGTRVIEMSEGDVFNAIDRAIAATTRCVCVRWNGFTPRKQGGSELIGDASIVAHVYETPVANTGAGAPHLLDMARAIANALHGAKAEGMSAPLFLVSITPVEEMHDANHADGVITCAVVFKAVASLI